MLKTWCDDTDWIHLAQNSSGSKSLCVPWFFDSVSYNITPDVTTLAYIQNFLFLFFLCFSYLTFRHRASSI